MLLDNAKSIYINNLSAKEIWYGGNKIWTPPAVVQSKCLTDTYTWAEISEISAAGTANNYFNVGDTAIMTSTSGTQYECVLIGIYIDNDKDGNPVLTFIHKNNTPLSWYTGSSSSFKAYTNSSCQPYSVSKNLANLFNTATGVLKYKNVGYYATATTSTVSTTPLMGWTLSYGEVNNTGTGVANGIYYPYLYENAVEIFGTATESYDYWTRETNGTYNVYWMGMDSNNKMVKVLTNARNESKYIVMAFCV